MKNKIIGALIGLTACWAVKADITAIRIIIPKHVVVINDSVNPAITITVTNDVQWQALTNTVWGAIANVSTNQP